MNPVKVAITIDTEEDQWGVYSPQSCSVSNIASIPLVQAIFDRFEVTPTYLVNYPVMKDDSASRMFRDIMQSGRCELGVHCHPWNTPPSDNDSGIEFDSLLCNLGYRKVWSKMNFLHNTFVERFSIRPISFRAGRWGFGPLVARTLIDLGYGIDSSISPFTDWSYIGGPDFFHAPTRPYRLDHTFTLLPPGSVGLLEAPPTMGFFQRNSRMCAAVLRGISRNGFLRKTRMIGLLDKSRMINLRWLSPETTSVDDMMTLARSRVDCGEDFLNMYFHSTSLLPGASPFVLSSQDLQRFLARIERFVEYASDAGWIFIPLRDMVPDY